MNRLSSSVKTYIGIILFLVLIAVISSLRSHLQFLSLAGIPFSMKEMISPHFLQPLAFSLINTAIVGGLGLVGLVLLSKTGLAGLWDKGVSHRQRFLNPALIGTGIGVFIVIFYLIASRFLYFEQLYSRQFPGSILSALNTAVSFELVFRLFFITFFVWVVSRFVVRNRWPNQVFWVVAALSACAHILTTALPIIIMYSHIIETALPVANIAETVLFAGLVSMFAAYYLRKAGFLAAASVAVWATILWQVTGQGLIMPT